MRTTRELPRDWPPPGVAYRASCTNSPGGTSSREPGRTASGRCYSTAARAAVLGVEVFIIDSVWFGEEYERVTWTLRNCTSNSVRFPKSLNSVVDRATFRTVAACGEKLQFAIWVESERSKPQVLYSFDKHPDWALQAEGYLPS
ncbi:hypothetical protein ARSEF1564_009356 [Beauveria bassiana]